MEKGRTKREGWVSCLSCGKTSKTFILERGDPILEQTSACPKCSNVAHTHNLQGLWSFMQAAAKEIAQIKLDMIDMQDTPEDRKMTDLIPRDAAIEEAFMDAVWVALKADATDLGKKRRILTAVRAIPSIDPAAIHEAALKESADIALKMNNGETAKAIHRDILALIGEKK